MRVLLMKRILIVLICCVMTGHIAAGAVESGEAAMKAQIETVRVNDFSMG